MGNDPKTNDVDTQNNYNPKSKLWLCCMGSRTEQNSRSKIIYFTNISPTYDNQMQFKHTKSTP